MLAPDCVLRSDADVTWRPTEVRLSVLDRYPDHGVPSRHLGLGNMDNSRNKHTVRDFTLDLPMGHYMPKLPQLDRLAFATMLQLDSDVLYVITEQGLECIVGDKLTFIRPDAGSRSTEVHGPVREHGTLILTLGHTVNLVYSRYGRTVTIYYYCVFPVTGIYKELTELREEIFVCSHRKYNVYLRVSRHEMIAFRREIGFPLYSTGISCCLNGPRPRGTCACLPENSL